MLLGRRSSEPWAIRVRVAVWPRHSWRRSLRYQTLRLSRLHRSPHTVALGLAIGAFVAVLPVMGIQMLMAVAIAWMLRGSAAAALAGTFVANPLTYPGLWLASYEMGCLILGVGSIFSGGLEVLSQARFDVAALSPELLAGSGWRLWKPMLIGAVPLGLAAAMISYFLGRRLVMSYHSSREALV
jgi:uncharacterized protein